MTRAKSNAEAFPAQPFSHFQADQSLSAPIFKRSHHLHKPDHRLHKPDDRLHNTGPGCPINLVAVTASSRNSAPARKTTAESCTALSFAASVPTFRPSPPYALLVTPFPGKDLFRQTNGRSLLVSLRLARSKIVRKKLVHWRSHSRCLCPSPISAERKDSVLAPPSFPALFHLCSVLLARNAGLEKGFFELNQKNVLGFARFRGTGGGESRGER